MSQTLLKKASRYLSSRTTRYTEGIANPNEPPTPTEERECRTTTTFPKITTHRVRVRTLALARPKSRLPRKRGSTFPRVAPMSTHTRSKRPAVRANRARHALRFPPIHARRTSRHPPSSACRQAESPSTPTLGAPMRPASRARLASARCPSVNVKAPKNRIRHCGRMCCARARPVRRRALAKHQTHRHHGKRPATATASRRNR